MLRATPSDDLASLVCACPAVPGLVLPPPPRPATPKGDAPRGTQPRKSERKGAGEGKEAAIPTAEALQQQAAQQRAAGVAVPTMGALKQELLLTVVLPMLSPVVHAQCVVACFLALTKQGENAVLWCHLSVVMLDISGLASSHARTKIAPPQKNTGPRMCRRCCYGVRPAPASARCAARWLLLLGPRGWTSVLARGAAMVWGPRGGSS